MDTPWQDIIAVTTKQQEIDASLEVLWDEKDKLDTQIRQLRDEQDALRDAQISELLSTIEPADFFHDHELRLWIATNEWSHGLGNSQLNKFISDAFESLAPNSRCFYDFSRHFADTDTHGEGPCVAVPQLAPKQGQPIDELQAALEVLAPIVEHDLFHINNTSGVEFEILGDVNVWGDSDGYATYTIVQENPTTWALTSGRTAYKSGPLQEVLEFLMKHYRL